MNKLIALCFLLCFTITANSQQEFGLLAYYPFDDCTATDVTGQGSNGMIVGNPTCGCGVSGDAIILDGVDDYIEFNGTVNGVFTTNSFTVSFYFKPFDANAPQDLFSTREDCSSTTSVLGIEYFINLNAISTEISEPSGSFPIAMANNLDLSCWHYYVLTRESNKIKLYLNGELIEERTSSGTIDLTNAGVFSLSNSPCLGTNGLKRFNGKIDELRIYNRALPLDEIQGLYYEPDMIGNRDTIVFLGDDFEAFTTKSCAIQYSWSPASDVDDPTIPNPIITPTETTTYQVDFLDAEGCTTSDTLLVEVIDPADLGCDAVFLPKAFTPNGDNLNDSYQISNPQVMQQMSAFEIFDRWGSRVFVTTNPFGEWDGNFNNKPVYGTVVYRLTYVCEGAETTKTGTISILR